MRGNLLERCQIAGLTCLQVNYKYVPVLVTAVILHVEKMPVVMSPRVHPDPADPVVGDSRGFLKAISRSHEYVHLSIVWSQVAEALAIRTQLHRGSVRVPKQNCP